MFKSIIIARVSLHCPRGRLYIIVYNVARKNIGFDNARSPLQYPLAFYYAYLFFLKIGNFSFNEMDKWIMDNIYNSILYSL